MGARQREAEPGAWGREVDDLLRGLSGGLLVGVPLIFTMETWWIGETVSMPRAVAFLAMAFAVNLAFVTVAGFRGAAPGARHPVPEAIEATGLAVVAAAGLLALLSQLRPDMALDAAIGRIAVDALPISVGVSVAHIVLAPRETRLGDGEDDAEGAPSGARGVVLDLGAAFAGALFLGLSIAPTDEVPMLATQIPTAQLPFVIAASLLLSYAIVFEAGFGGVERRRRATGPFQRPISETVLAYVVSLITAAGTLWLYGQIGTGDDWFVAFAQVIVLGLPAAIGAAAGRLAA